LSIVSTIPFEDDMTPDLKEQTLFVDHGFGQRKLLRLDNAKWLRASNQSYPDYSWLCVRSSNPDGSDD
jgi:hypothetical protein